MSPNFRRGAAEIQKANEAAQSGGGDYRPFLPNLYWKDGDQKYLLILNPLEDIPMVLMHPKVWTGEGHPYAVIARTEPGIGEDADPIEDKWDYGPQDLNVCVAVELEPDVEVVRGRPRPVGFKVKTREFSRKVRDHDGEPTDEREEVTAPAIGLIAQSPNNFFNHIASKDATVAPVNEMAICVTRVGGDRNTDYEVDAFDDKDLDLTGLLDYVDGISYLSEEEMEALLTAMEADDAAEDEWAQVRIIGETLLNKRLDEMSDLDYYNEVLESIDEPARFGKSKKGGSKSKTKEKAERPKRASQRRSRRSEPAEPAPEPEDTSAEPEAQEPAEEPEPKAKPGRSQRRQRKPAAPKAATKTSPVRERLEALRAKQEAAKASA